MTQLINENVNKQLDLLVQKCFAGNRLLDRMMTQLDVKFVMKKTESKLHPILAHAYPLIADMVSGYQSSRNMLTAYLEIPTDITDYSSPIEIFDKYVEYSIELEKIVVDSIEIAEEEGDRMTKIFLESFLLKLNPYTNQALILSDKIHMYGNETVNWMLFDRHIEDFLIVSAL